MAPLSALPVRTARRRSWLAVLVTATLLAACGGSGGATTSRQTATPAEGFSPVVASAEVLVGRNRFALGILDNRTGAPLPDARVRLRFFELHGNEGTLRFETDATFRAPGRDAGLAPVIPHRHADGTIHPHANVEADVGVYTAEVMFDKPGPWGVEALITAKDGRQGAVRASFDVAATTQTPLPGQPAPRSRQPTIRDVKDIAEIDSSAEPDPALHDLTIADAIASGKPTLVVFATPGFCSSRVCGPSVEIVRKLMPRYAGRVNFIHVEVYKDFRKLTPSDTFEEWHLRSEPWFFIIDGGGIIAARFDGPTTLAELDAALAQVVQ
jgi:hypothetical protein